MYPKMILVMMYFGLHTTCAPGYPVLNYVDGCQPDAADRRGKGTWSVSPRSLIGTAVATSFLQTVDLKDMADWSMCTHRLSKHEADQQKLAGPVRPHLFVSPWAALIDLRKTNGTHPALASRAVRTI